MSRGEGGILEAQSAVSARCHNQIHCGESQILDIRQYPNSVEAAGGDGGFSIKQAALNADGYNGEPIKTLPDILEA